MRRSHRRDDDLIEHRRSAAFGPYAYREETGLPLARYCDGFYPHMLIEDVSLHLMPIGGRTKEGRFDVTLHPDSSELRDLVSDAFEGRFSHHGSLAESICDLFAETVRAVLFFGCDPYELVRLTERGSDRVVSVVLDEIFPPSFQKSPEGYMQLLPRQYALQEGCPLRRLLDTQELFIFRLPAQYERHREDTLFQLHQLSVHMMPDFALRSMSGLDRSGFVFSDYRTVQQKALAIATRAFGWNGRGSLDENIMEYYWLKRYFTYQRFLAATRASFLSELNRMIARCAVICGVDSQLFITGLPSIADAENALADLEDGSRSFDELLKPFLDF